MLDSRQRVSVPDVKLEASTLTAKDQQDLAFFMKEEVRLNNQSLLIQL